MQPDDDPYKAARDRENAQWHAYETAQRQAGTPTEQALYETMAREIAERFTWHAQQCLLANFDRPCDCDHKDRAKLLTTAILSALSAASKQQADEVATLRTQLSNAQNWQKWMQQTPDEQLENALQDAMTQAVKVTELEAQLAQQAERAAEAERKIAIIIRDYDAAEKALREQQAEEIARLRVALEDYGQHGDNCDFKYRPVGTVFDESLYPCTCGFTSALSEGTQT